MLRGKARIKAHKIFGQFTTSPLIHSRPNTHRGEQKSQDLKSKPVLFLYIGISFPTVLGYVISFPSPDRTPAKVKPHAKKLIKIFLQIFQKK